MRGTDPSTRLDALRSGVAKLRSLAHVLEALLARLLVEASAHAAHFPPPEGDQSVAPFVHRLLCAAILLYLARKIESEPTTTKRRQ